MTNLYIIGNGFDLDLARFLYDENQRSEDVFLKISMILNHSSTQVSRRYLGITKEEISDVYAGFDIIL
jgi:hypothetical protein